MLIDTAELQRQLAATWLQALNAVIVVIVAMVGCMLLAAIAAGRQLHAERDLRQCELLVQAGADRAAYRLATETDYRGETWTLAADKIVGSSDGKLTIEVSTDAGQKTRQLSIVAEYPAGGETSIRRSRTISISSRPFTVQE